MMDQASYFRQISKKRFDCITVVMLSLSLAAMFTPTQAFLSASYRIPLIPSRVSSKCQTKIPFMNLAPSASNKSRISKRFGTIVYLSAIAEDQMPEDAADSDLTEEALTLKQPLKLKEDEEFIKAIQEVKGAALNVTESSVQFTSAIIKKGPGIIGRLLAALVDTQLCEDMRRRKKTYVSDWTDAFDNKRAVVPAILFLYFACLAPVVSFGTIATQITEGSIGVVEFLIASGGAGMFYSIFSGQPMTFVAPTGLTLAFLSGLYRYCTLQGYAFLPVYTWVGLWTSFFMITLGLRGSSKFIRYCTRFTDEVFNALLSLNFIYEACASLRRNFMLANPMNLSMPFVSLSMALGTFWSTKRLTAFETSMFFNAKIRSLMKDFGPVAVIIAFSGLNQLQSIKKFGVPTLRVPNKFELSGGREFLIPFMTVPENVRWLCVFPAILLTSLFFMDQNISARIVNREENGLKKGPAYNMDMIALGVITGVLSVFGLPWMCGATVQSMNHVRALTSRKFNEETKEMEINSVVETRVTGLVIHAMLAASIYLLPLLKILPIPVVSGVFLYLGRKLMTGNTFLQRVRQSCAESKRLPESHPIHLLGRKKMNIFTAIQVVCLAGLWGFKQNSATAIFFPALIGLLMAIRVWVLPRFFLETELVALGDPTPQ